MTKVTLALAFTFSLLGSGALQACADVQKTSDMEVKTCCGEPEKGVETERAPQSTEKKNQRFERELKFTRDSSI